MKQFSLLFVLPLALAAQVEDNETIRKTYPVASRVEVENINGYVHVTAAATNAIELVAQKRFTGDMPEDLDRAKREITLETETTGDRLCIFVDGPFRENRRHSHGESHYGFRYNFELRVPARTSVVLKTVNGGDVYLKGTEGSFELRNVNGAVTAEDVRGSGSAHTVNGAVKLALMESPREPLDAKTVNGEIRVEVPAGFQADVRVKTFNGEVFTDFPATALGVPAGEAQQRNGRFVYKRDRAFAVRIGSGGVEHRLETLNGDILIKQRGQ